MKYYRTVKDVFLKNRREDKLRFQLSNVYKQDDVVRFFLLPKEERNKWYIAKTPKDKQILDKINRDISLSNAKATAKKILITPFNLVNFSSALVNTVLFAPVVAAGSAINYGSKNLATTSVIQKPIKVISLIAGAVVLAPILLTSSVLSCISNVFAIPDKKIEQSLIGDYVDIYHRHEEDINRIISYQDKK